ncbi:N-acyl homoserine lactonase family protein, partial [Clostridiales bacterium BAD-6]|nr:N-acyl homoserine lactonase family protein [Sinanaerobacter chloroacetimidivorans]
MMKGLKAGVIPCGVGIVDSNFMISFHTVLTWDHPDVRPKWFRSPHTMFVIQHPTAGWILWDLGSRVDSGDTWPKHITKFDKYEGSEELRIENQLASLGLKPEDIKYVILSHLHMDHTGYIDLFKDTAEFFVSRTEMMNACATVMNSTDVSTHGWYIREEVLCPVKKYHYIDRDTEIFPGITLITLPGHTPGSLGCILELESGTRILTGDAITCDEIFHGALPGFLNDSVAFHESIRKVKDYQKKYDAEIWFSHDPDQFEKWEKVPHLY